MFDFLLTTAISVLTLTVMWLAGSRSRKAWGIGIVNQVLWFIFIFRTDAYGLLLLSIAITAVYVRNFVKWEPERD